MGGIVVGTDGPGIRTPVSTKHDLFSLQSRPAMRPTTRTLGAVVLCRDKAAGEWRILPTHQASRLRMDTAIPLHTLCASYDKLWVTFTFTSLPKVRRVSVFRRPVPVQTDRIPRTTDDRYPSAVLITTLHVSAMGSDPTVKIWLTGVSGK